MKEKIVIPLQYAEIIKAEAERRNISIEDLVHIALKKMEAQLTMLLPDVWPPPWHRS